MREKGVKNKSRLNIGIDPDVKLFNNAGGMLWAGVVVSEKNGVVVLKHARRIRVGLIRGAGDLIGWHSFIIRPEHVGRRIAQFVSGETKHPKGGVVSPWQKIFFNNVNKAGGKAIILSNPNDIYKIKEWSNE